MRKMGKISRIGLDMDEVLVDFRGGACEIHGKRREEVDQLTIENGIWDMIGPLGLKSQTEFWHPINEAGADFWLNLNPHPWFDELIWLAEKLVGDQWFIFTSPSYDPGCYSGKIEWLQKRLGSSFNKVAPFPYKHLFAQPGVLLIDDREETVEKFIIHKGEGLVFPSVGNKLFEHRFHPMDYLYTELTQAGVYHA